MRPTTFVKQPWEERVLHFDLTDAMATGDTVDTIIGVSVSTGGVDQAAMVGATAVNAARTGITAVILGGTDGVTYWIRVRVQMASGDKIEDDLKMIVKKVGDV